MSTETKQEQGVKQAAKQAVKVQTVYGQMVHVVTGKVFDGETDIDAIDSWVQAQIDAGKLKLVK